MPGKLILVPSPISDDGVLHPTAIEKLETGFLNDDVIAVEDHRPARRRWIKWGLDRKAIDTFVLYNEHSRDIEKWNLLEQLRSGKNVFLLSDAGLPAFCDPGVELVDICHQNGIIVTATPFDNSVALALALSGFSHQKFSFEGFLPQKSEERKLNWDRIARLATTLIVMDTPYRLPKVIGELKENQELAGRQMFFAISLGNGDERLVRGCLKDIEKVAPFEKKPFILIFAPL